MAKTTVTASIIHNTGSNPSETPEPPMDTQPRKRGRRRKTNNEETAAERRRTQVRIAQRAYRARQEETTTNLRARIRQLEDIAEMLSTTFLSFSDDLMHSGMLDVFPDLSQSLQQTTQKFVSLANQASELATDGAVEERDRAPSPSSTQGVDTAAQQSSETPLGHGNPTSPNLTKNTFSLEDLVGMKNLLQVSKSRQPSENSNSSQSQAMHSFITIPDDLFAHTLAAADTCPSPTSQLGLRPPKSPFYGPRSPLFAERLHWVVTSRAYRHLLDPSIPDWKLARPFGFLLGLMTRQQITAYFGTALKYSWSYDVLDQYGVPMLRVGGAGSHYSRKVQKSSIQASYVLSDEALGSIYEHLPGSDNYEELWFDSEDVAGFLEENRILLVKEDGAEAQFQTTFGPRTAQSAFLAVNEDKLIIWLSRHATCLGRMAGFRKRDLESFILQFGWPL